MMADENQRLSDLPALGALQAADLIYVLRGNVDYALDAAALVASLTPDYAAMLFHSSETLTIDYANVFHLVDFWSSNGPANVSTADQANDQIVFGGPRVYKVAHCMEGIINAASQLIACTVFSISQTTAAITAITEANPGVVTTSAAHGLSNGDKIKFVGIVGMVELNDKIFCVNNVTANTFEIQDLSPANFDTTGFASWVSGGTVAEATSTGSHTHQTYPNNIRTATCGGYLFDATSGDAIEMYIANDSGVTNFGMESARMMITGV